MDDRVSAIPSLFALVAWAIILTVLSVGLGPFTGIPAALLCVAGIASRHSGPTTRALSLAILLVVGFFTVPVADGMREGCGSPDSFVFTYLVLPFAYGLVFMLYMWPKPISTTKTESGNHEDSDSDLQSAWCDVAFDAWAKGETGVSQSAIESFMAEHGVSREQTKELHREFERRMALLAPWLPEGELPQVESPLPLKKGEVCHFVARASRREYTRDRVHVRTHAGFSVKPFKSLPRVYLGGSRGRTVNESAVRKSDGLFVLTSERILFQTASGVDEVWLTDIRAYEVFANALQIDVAEGKSSQRVLYRHDDELSAVAGLLLRIAVRIANEE